MLLLSVVQRLGLVRHFRSPSGPPWAASRPELGLAYHHLAGTHDPISLTIIHLPDAIVCHVTPLSDLQACILELLCLSPSIYTQLAGNL
jgi:hypothetical protein